LSLGKGRGSWVDRVSEILSSEQLLSVGKEALGDHGAGRYWGRLTIGQNCTLSRQRRERSTSLA
jgi:hypothetical protein